MTKSMTLSHLFEYGIAAENASRDFYLGLAQKFSSRPDISSFWKIMADEEICHARTLEKARNSLSSDKLNASIDPSMEKKGQALCKLSILDINLLDSIRNLEDAYQLAHELESSDINIVFSFLKLKLIPDGEKDHLSTMSIEHHIQKLVDFPKIFGDAQIRKGIVVGV
jgi:rubrerythrin